MYRTSSFEDQKYQKANHYMNKDNSMRARWDRQNWSSNSYNPRPYSGGESSINTYKRQKPLGNTLSFNNLTGQNSVFTPGSPSYMPNSRPANARPNYLNTDVNDDGLFMERMQNNLNSWRYQGDRPNNSDRWRNSGASQNLWQTAQSIMGDGMQEGDRKRLNDIWQDISGTGSRSGGANFNFNNLF